MSAESFTAYVLDQLASLRGISARRMFSGAGLFKSGVMFGLVIREELYFKVDESTREAYAERRSTPFTYKRGAKVVALSYWRVPEAILEEGDVLAAWAREAVAVALRSRKPAQPRQRTKSP